MRSIRTEVKQNIQNLLDVDNFRSRYYDYDNDLKLYVSFPGFELTTLENSPTIMNGKFFCTSNKLTNLIGCPKNMHMSSYFFNNPLCIKFTIWSISSFFLSK